MRKTTSLIIVIVAFLFTGSAQNQKNYIDQPYLDVTGYADSLVTPNEIYIRIIISEKDSRDRVSVEEYEEKLVDSLKALGINTEKDLVTDDLGSNYRFYLLKKKDVIKTKQYLLKVSTAALASRVFMLLEDLDLSNASVSHVNHSELDAIKGITRIKAVENAKAKAVALTKPLNQTVGAAIYLTDNETAASVGPMVQGRQVGVVIQGYGKTKGFREMPKIEFEKMRVSTTVSAKFVLK